MAEWFKAPFVSEGSRVKVPAKTTNQKCFYNEIYRIMDRIAEWFKAPTLSEGSRVQVPPAAVNKNIKTLTSMATSASRAAGGFRSAGDMWNFFKSID